MILIFPIILLSFSPTPIASGEGVITPPMVILELPKTPVDNSEIISRLPINRDKFLVSGDMQGRHGGQCVEFVQSYLNLWGNPYFKGTAIDIPLNANFPEIGWVVLTTEGPVGHVAVITDVLEDRLILVESNYGDDETILVGRELPLDSPFIRGYFAVH